MVSAPIQLFTVLKFVGRHLWAITYFKWALSSWLDWSFGAQQVADHVIKLFPI
jgi:hypothetical protein